MSAKWKYALAILGGLLAGILVEALSIGVLLLAALLSQGCFGVCEAVNTFLFPFGALALHVHVSFLSADSICSCMQGLQMPLYGLWLGHAWTRKKFMLAALAIVILHVAAWREAAAVGGYPPDKGRHMCESSPFLSQHEIA